MLRKILVVDYLAINLELIPEAMNDSGSRGSLLGTKSALTSAGHENAIRLAPRIRAKLGVATDTSDGERILWAS
jgi:hypothetical protein